MNPNIQHDLMQARIAEMHRQGRRINTGRTAHAAIPRFRWLITGLVATAMALVAWAPRRDGHQCPATR